MLAAASSRELSEWHAYYNLEHQDRVRAVEKAEEQARATAKGNGKRWRG